MGAPGFLIAKRYELQALIGGGAFGEVWRAFDHHRNQAVAIKLIRTLDKAATWLEASLLTALRSEHILEVNNADVFVDVPYLDTALAVCSLDARAVPWGVEPSQAIDWMRRSLRGLNLCHTRGLLHRDVKPHNVFLSQEGEAKLGDFGVAALMDAAGTAAPHGDMQIWAPEFFAGGRASVASDVYAAACTLYALVAGHLPYAGFVDPADLSQAILRGDHAHVRDEAPHVSLALAEKIAKGMAKDPHDRFPTAAAFDSALALPTRRRRFTPEPPHPGHVRCWSTAGMGADMSVCVLPGTKTSRVIVESRYASSGNRVTKHCFEATLGQLSARLRQVFNDLR
jgi:serine/threonine-protein kinase